jgi:hypothetical protein
VLALVVSGTRLRTVTEDELRDHCRTKLAGYKVPQAIEFRDELARTATGKLQKFKLRAPYWDGPRPPGQLTYGVEGNRAIMTGKRVEHGSRQRIVPRSESSAPACPFSFAPGPEPSGQRLTASA